jgi:hypothetical protein
MKSTPSRILRRDFKATTILNNNSSSKTKASKINTVPSSFHTKANSRCSKCGALIPIHIILPSALRSIEMAHKDAEEKLFSIGMEM